MAKEKTQESFAKQFEELEKLARDLESQESLDIETSVKKFERGLELAQSLKKRLSEVDLRVKKIQERFSHQND